MAKQRKRQREKLAAPTSEYRDSEGNVLKLRGSLTPGTRREYADILGIPFDFTAKPVIAPPQPPRETVQVKAISPDRDALEIRFPRVEGYRAELPEGHSFTNRPLLTFRIGNLVGPQPFGQQRHSQVGDRRK